MLPVEQVLKMERESEDRRKEISRRRKRKEKQIKYSLLFLAGLIIFTLSPQGLTKITEFCSSRLTSPTYQKIFIKASDILWVYGYLKETYKNYETLYNDRNSSESLVKQSFLNMALTQYKLNEYNISLMMYKIYIYRWANEPKEVKDSIDRRCQLIFTVSPAGRGTIPEYDPRWKWLVDLNETWVTR